MNKTTELQQSNAANLVMSVRKEKGTESILGCSEVTELLLQNSLQAFWWSGFSPKLCHPHAFYRPHSPAGQTTPISFCKKRWSVQHLNGTIRKSQNTLLHNLSAHNYLSGSSKWLVASCLSEILIISYLHLCNNVLNKVSSRDVLLSRCELKLLLPRAWARGERWWGLTHLPKAGYKLAAPQGVFFLPAHNLC